MDTARTLRQTSDALLRDLDVLVAIEEEKRTLEPGDPRLVELATRIDEIAQRVLAGANHQVDLTKVISDEAASGAPGTPAASIDDTPRPIQAVLSEWRDAERRAAAATPGSAEAAEAEALVERLRTEYRRAQDAARERR